MKAVYCMLYILEWLLTETLSHYASTMIIDAADIAKTCSTIEMLNTSIIQDGRSTIPQNIGTTPPARTWFAFIPSIAHWASLVADAPYFQPRFHQCTGHSAISLNSSTYWLFKVKGIIQGSNVSTKVIGVLCSEGGGAMLLKLCRKICERYWIRINIDFQRHLFHQSVLIEAINWRFIGIFLFSNF